jgi:hypothetical protein
MVGPYKNKLIADLFSSLNEINSKNTQCYIIGGLIKNAHDLTQKQLDHLDYLLCTPFTKQKGAPKKEERKWKMIYALRRKYEIDQIIPTYSEVINFIKQNTPEIQDESSYRAIFNDIEPYIYYIPSGKGRRKKTPEEGN